jgi:hypothetical protein
MCQKNAYAFLTRSFHGHRAAVHSEADMVRKKLNITPEWASAQAKLEPDSADPLAIDDFIARLTLANE